MYSKIEKSPQNIQKRLSSIAGEDPCGEPPTRTLFVRNISSNVDDSELRALFEEYGDIHSPYTVSKSRGFVMISYYDIRSSQAAVRALQNKQLGERKLDIHFSSPKDTPYGKDVNHGTLLVFNLAPSVSNEELENMFGTYGDIKEIREPSRRSHKVIEFFDVRSADTAYKALNNCEYFPGKCIKLGYSRYADARPKMTSQLDPELEESGSGSDNNILDLHSTLADNEMTRETECTLVISCNDSHDVDETNFIKAILKELHEREVTFLTYNLLGRRNLDVEMLYRSGVGIMVLSNSWAGSSQSLDHLVKIMEYKIAINLVIIPIYFKVTKVTLPNICGLEGRFETEFLQHLRSARLGRVQKWKMALAEIALIDGHEWTKETEVMLAVEVAISACFRLYLKSSESLVRILALLNHSQPSDTDIVGIWGMAGVGKTSIAREIFGTLAPQYDLCYFLQDFYLMCQTKGLGQMRDDFFSKIFGEEKLSINACDIKPSFMKDWLHNKTILVVLDDVSSVRDVEAVVGGFGWFSHGHKIILTSRRKQVLLQCKVKKPYELQQLCETESLRLCKLYFNGESVVISDLMNYGSGIPLALKVLGSSISKQHVNNMVEHLQRLRINPPTQIQETFRKSFDGLDGNEKNIFLDLACFFRGENTDHVVQLLDACGFFTYLGISDLIDESLISLLDGRIEIPIPFQDCGRFIVHEEDEDPCERSRLWDSKDIADVLTNNSGTEAIEGIFLDASDLTCELSPTVFSEMYRLRLLKIYCSTTSGNQCKLRLPQGLETLPDELRLLHWEHYPLEYLPHKFIPENLVEINMPYSNMEKLWEGKKNLEKLKKIKLSHSRKLTDILMLSEALNLEHIDLEGCTSLIDVSTSITHLRKLVSLNMKDCCRLRSLPSMVDLRSLKFVNLSGCSELEDVQEFSPNLKELYLAGTAIRELPLSVENLTELSTLDLENCVRLQKLASGVRNSRSIVELKLSGCTSLELRKRKR